MHENVKDSDEAAWVERCIAKVLELAHAAGRPSWRCVGSSLTRVKWYAPHIRHVVLDVNLAPHQATVQNSIR